MKATENFFCFSITPKDFLASEDFLLLSLEQKGLLFHAMLICWANGSIPAAPAELGRLLGAPPEQIAELLPSLTRYFSTKGDRLVCPFLDAERHRVREVSRKHKKAADDRWAEERRKKEEEKEKARKKQEQNQHDACARNAGADANAIPSESESESESESQPAAASPPQGARPAGIPDAAADFLTTAGEELGFSAFEVHKVLDEENGNGNRLTLAGWKEVVKRMRDRSRTHALTNPPGLLRTIAGDVREERKFNAEHPEAPPPPPSALTIPDDDAEQLAWNLEPGGDREAGLKMLETFAPSWGEAERADFAHLFGERVMRDGPGYLGGKSYAAVLDEIARNIPRTLDDVVETA
ncbi:MAG: hypothetical protein ABR899_02495 [Candidatus Krumholzibacteriaceae bacterium]